MTDRVFRFPLAGPALCTLLVLSCVLPGCKRAAPPPAPAPAAAVTASEEPVVRSKEQAQQALLALPELQAWSEQISASSGGRASGAVIEDNPQPREINGKRYYQLSFVENRGDQVRRRESFLVAHTDDEILVDDVETDTLLSLQEWRRTIEKVQLGGAR